ncbi:chemotaxis protein CheA [Methyloterricola oryzae]|uniref:chemotaxis protein CheA n=1 Tax=Methyloterricola oryzae TaxID=1495050 RepID=UPI0005EB517C|nr:chemotaxis protein CheA [Methyloterricola oryzae]
MELEEALPTFVAESKELLRDMEDSLLLIEERPDDTDLINAIFRAAHTIKGTAGLFGFDHVVRFTHAGESVLDRVRGGQLSVTPDLVALLLKVCDQLGVLIDLIAKGEQPDTAIQACSDGLAASLKAYLGAPASERAGTQGLPTVQEARVEREVAHDAVESNHWHISLRFGPDVLRNGMDPMSFLRFLNTFGRIVRIVTLTDDMPPADEMDPESCYLGFELDYQTDADKATIENAFEFVRDDSVVRILPPHSKIAEYQELIQNLPEEDMRLGEILVRCGTLTEEELKVALQLQAADDKVPPSPIGEVVVEQGLVRPSVVATALERQEQVRESRSSESRLIRVDAERLDGLINLIGELIIAGAGVNLIAKSVGAAELFEATATLSRLVEEVRDSALTLRMVPIGATFNRFQRVVHDVSKELGKDIELTISGAETELDKTVVEKIGDPLTHLVRNAMDHGIEPADVRRSRGKPERGSLKLNAFHDAGSIVIEVADDGAGFNKQRILEKALEKDLVKPDQALTDQEIYQLIFEPGFSTVEKVSNLSGRGVGMDVVRRNIQALRGGIELESEEGYGATVRIRLPLTLAIIDGFMVAVGDATYVVPLDMVMECIELAQDSETDYINLRGEVLPCIRLRDLFDVKGPVPRRENVVVVRHGAQRAGLVVDRLLGEFQTVIKPLGRLFSQTQGLGGFTILGSGQVGLILDVPGLIRQIVRIEEHDNAHLNHATSRA